MNKFKKIILLLIALMFLIVMIVSGTMIIKELSDRQKDKDTFSELADIVYQPQEIIFENPNQNNTISSDKDPENTESEVTGPQYQVKRNLAPLYEQNNDFLAWLCIPDTAIDYPVMYTPNDVQKYLYKNFYGEYSKSGILFLEETCSPDGDNLIVYGHNMKNGTMFGTLKKYAEQEYLSEHPIIEWETMNGCEEYEIFAVAYVKKTDDWYRFASAYNEDDYNQWINYIMQKAKLTTDITPQYGQRLLTLSTCHGSGSDVRLLVIAAHK